MAEKNVAIKEALKAGWRAMSENIGFFFGIFVVATLAYVLPAVLMGLIDNTSEGTALVLLVLQIVSWILSTIVSMGYIKIALGFTKPGRPKISDLFSAYPLFWKYLGGMILYGLIVTGGLMLFIVPGVIWALTYQFYGYAIIDKGQGPLEALRTSSKLTKGVRWGLLGFALLAGLINYAGMMALVIGLFATVPTTMVAHAHLYRRLLAQTFPETEKRIMPASQAAPPGVV